jgi:S-adenosylmethionine hydrolase
VASDTIVTLTTDFGTSDAYVGIMKGVILGLAPSARLVDLSHHVRPHDTAHACLLLYSSYRYFPSNTVHLVVVDPGVGTARRPIAVRTQQGFFVGPDNGVFTYVMASAPAHEVVAITNEDCYLPHTSETFHGRDVFAPAAAKLAGGLQFERLGPRVADPITLPVPALKIGERRVVGEVLHVDHFGNVITSIGMLKWVGGDLELTPAFFGAEGGHRVRLQASAARVVIGGNVITGIRRTYSDGITGEPLALVGSMGFLELAVPEGRAASALEVAAGSDVPVEVWWSESAAACCFAED